MEWKKAGNSWAPAKSQDRTGVPRAVPQGIGTFPTFLVGWERRHHPPVVLPSGVPANSIVSIYPREWGTDSKKLGFLQEKEVPGKGCSHNDSKAYQDGGNGVGWSVGSQWLLGLKPERWFQGTGSLPTPAEQKCGSLKLPGLPPYPLQPRETLLHLTPPSLSPPP